MKKRIYFLMVFVLLVSCNSEIKQNSFNVGDTVYLNMIEIRKFDLPEYQAYPNYKQIKSLIIYANGSDSLLAIVKRRIWVNELKEYSYELSYKKEGKPDLNFGSTKGIINEYIKAMQHKYLYPKSKLDK